MIITLMVGLVCAYVLASSNCMHIETHAGFEMQLHISTKTILKKRNSTEDFPLPQNNSNKSKKHREDSLQNPPEVVRLSVRQAWRLD